MQTSVRVVVGAKAFDLSFPAELAIKDWIDDAVDYLGQRWGDDPDVGFDFARQTAWTIAPVGAPPIERDLSLNAARVTDGDLVVLQGVSRTERYRPLAEDVVDAVAVVNKEPVFGRADLMWWLSCWAALMLMGVAAGGVYGWSTIAGSRLWWGLGLLVFGVAGVIAGVGLARRDEHQLAFGIGVGAAVNLVVGAALTVPLPEGARWLGAPHVAAGAVVAVICVLSAPGGPSRWRAWQAFVGAGGLIAAVAAVGIGYGWSQWVWPLVVLAGLLLIKNAARWVMRVARIALPPIPRPGEEVSTDQLLDPVVDVAALAGESRNQHVWAQIISSVPSSSARLTERSMLTQQLLAGFIAAGCTAGGVGSLVLLQRGHFLVHTTVLCVLVVVVLVFRARLPADRRCVWALLSTAAVIVVGAGAKMLWWWPAWSPLIVGVLGVAAGVVVVAVLAVGHEKADGHQRGLDQIALRWLEYLDATAVALVIPLLAWVSGLYDLLRNLGWLGN